VRLTGVAGHELVAPSAQRELFAPQPTRADRLNAALDRITDRFGGAAVAPADVVAAEAPDTPAPRRPRS
jgi:DNA polymerase-4